MITTLESCLYYTAMIRLVQNGCSFHGLRSKDPYQHLKDFLKLMNSLELDAANRKRTRRAVYFNFPFAIKLAIGLNVFQQDPSPLEELTSTFSIAQSFHWEGPWEWTVKLTQNDILMFQRHQGESLLEAWTRFKDLLQKFPHHGIDRWLQIQIFYEHVSFHLKCDIDRAASCKLRNKSTDEYWEIIENLALYDHEGWNDSKNIVKPVKPSSTHTPQAYADAVYSNPNPRNQNKPPKQKSFTFHERTGPNPQPQALGTSFEARVRDYMAAHTERMERFENAIFKQREEINDRMAEMFGLLKELTTSKAPKKVLIREEAKYPITKNMPVKKVEKENEAENGTKNETIKRVERGEVVKAPSSQPVGYYLKYRINETLIEGLEAFMKQSLRKKITRKEYIGGNFEIPCNIGGLKHMNALVDQGSDVNSMPLSTYMKLTDERPTKTEGPSIHRDLSRVTKVLDGGSDVLKGAIMVVEVVVKWNGGGI
ncbi:hypothetical protein Tco_0778682 [Tanacetum coccineum]